MNIFFTTPQPSSLFTHWESVDNERGEMEERVGARIHERQHTLRPHTYSTCFSWCGGRAVVGVRVIIKKYSSLLTPFMNSNFLFRYLFPTLNSGFYVASPLGARRFVCCIFHLLMSLHLHLASIASRASTATRTPKGTCLPCAFKKQASFRTNFNWN